MKKNLGRFSYIFLGIGCLMLVISVLLWISTKRFIARAATTHGTVVELIESRDNDGSTWKPVVRYQAPDGQVITYTANFSSNPPAYDVGETVEVMYAPDDPQDVKIRGFMSLWFAPTLLGGMGLIFGGVGGGILLARRGGERKKNYLMAYGNAIETDLQGVERNTTLEVNGRHPWRITSQWLDPVTNKLRVFYSENLWFDPSRFVTAKQVTVLLDPKDPKRYHMDLSFLPELDEAK